MADRAKKYAAIYVRTSTEYQGKKISPEVQEEESRELCQRLGYEVVDVYRDTEKYRVGNRMVEPGGGRADRPELRRLLTDAYLGKFHGIVAWKEDRLYRGYRPMIDVLDCIEETEIDIELVTEHFDKQLAPVKAWAAKMELDAKRDRFAMGVKGRLAQGKVWCSVPPFGYDYVDGYLIIDGEEANWVHLIWKWYGDDISIREIRARLIAGGARQRRANTKYVWSKRAITNILRKDYYFTGIFTVTWQEDTYEVSIPTIIDEAVYNRVQARRARWEKYPVGNRTTDALSAGLLYCAACDVRMSLGFSTKNGRRYPYYRCTNNAMSVDVPGCVKASGIRWVDAKVWKKIQQLINTDEFETRLKEKIDSLKIEEDDAEITCKRIQIHLDEIMHERQKVVTWARKGFITEGDLQGQLSVLSFEEKSAKRELADARTALGDKAEQLMSLAKNWKYNVSLAMQKANTKPRDDAEAKLIFQMQRKIVESLVRKILLYENRDVVLIGEIVVGDEFVVSDDPSRWTVLDHKPAFVLEYRL